MQVTDAEFTVVAKRKRGSIWIKILLGAACAVLLAALVFRILGWAGSRQASEIVLVNPWNSVESTGYTPKLTDIGGGMRADERCVEELKQMLADCAAEGNQPYICSAYRSRDTQQELYDNKIQRLIDDGTDPEAAPRLAAREVAAPGTSEHELGLAFDIVDINYQILDEGQENTPTAKWLMENAWRYGFILRYPAETEDITGVAYEPWHYRYVGQGAAEQIMQLGVTLEEYVSMFYSEEAVITYEE